MEKKNLFVFLSWPFTLIFLFLFFLFDRRPQSRRDYPLNLSILLSGGKETNQDFLSSGERTGKSPALNPAVLPLGTVVFGRIHYPAASDRVQVHLEWGHLPAEGARPVETGTRRGRISP